MELILSAICEQARVRPDGRLDLSGVFSQLQAPGFPAAQDAMTAVFLVEWSDDEAGRQPLRADLLDEEGETVLTIEGHTDVKAAPSGHAPPQTRLVMPLERVVFPHPGTYHFRLAGGSTSRRGCSIHVAQHAGAE